MSLGQNIYRLRNEKGMSQSELAEALNVSRQSISKWETDGSVPELDKLLSLSSLFGVSLDELVKGSADSEYCADNEYDEYSVDEDEQPASFLNPSSMSFSAILLFSIVTAKNSYQIQIVIDSKSAYAPINAVGSL